MCNCKRSAIASTMIVGMCVGLLVGSFLENAGAAMAFGMSGGIAVGAVIDALRRRKDPEGESCGKGKH